MMQRLLICTDLDRTLLPNGKQAESPTARERFARLVSRPDVFLAYVSGRHRDSVATAIERYQLPVPNWVVGDVGSTLYHVQADRWEPSHLWEQEIAGDWRGLIAADIQPFLDALSLPELTPQEAEKQNRYKLSYYVPVDADIEALQHRISAHLAEQTIAASLIYSIDEALEIGLLDILPARATKLHAVEFLMRHQGFDYANTVFAGDSGNDLPVLASAVPSVLVANATQDVIDQARRQAQQQATLDRFYLAQGNFLGMNGHYSAGILEGIAHYHPQTKPWMESGWMESGWMESGEQAGSAHTPQD
ncbi:HAD-IIB family hydrolase [Alkalinema sp. FACHB-956]|uniref:HAD-IIB family hydrolase n=1 Tax=Alkalinema sp. FACHB-956 TaxID=2692768 RepID=UPI0016865D9C|nr:HAD-IIB family hydrolase [Alkalinema sp. FACHB-956]MBD2327127.1 HAD-IIB family hydrolase [Alkalinema sp. FACHB-956]